MVSSFLLPGILNKSNRNGLHSTFPRPSGHTFFCFLLDTSSFFYLFVVCFSSHFFFLFIDLTDDIFPGDTARKLGAMTPRHTIDAILGLKNCEKLFDGKSF